MKKIIMKVLPIFFTAVLSCAGTIVAYEYQKYRDGDDPKRIILEFAEKNPEEFNEILDEAELPSQTVSDLSEVEVQSNISSLQAKENYLIDVLQPYESNSYKQPSEPIMMAGNSYRKSFVLGSYPDANAIYNLNGNYTEIEGIIGHVDGSGNYNSNIKIYGDDVLLTDIDIPYLDLPKEFLVNVSDVHQLKVIKESGWAEVGLAEITVK